MRQAGGDGGGEIDRKCWYDRQEEVRQAAGGGGETDRRWWR